MADSALCYRAFLKGALNEIQDIFLTGVYSAKTLT